MTVRPRTVATWVRRVAERRARPPRATGCTCGPARPVAADAASWGKDLHPADGVPYEGYSIDCLVHGCFHQTHEATGVMVRSVSPAPEDPVGYYHVILEDGQEWNVPANEAIPPRFPCPQCGSTYVRPVVTV